MSETDPQREPRSGRSRAVRSAREHVASAKEHKTASVGGTGSVGLLIYGLCTHDQELFLGAVPGVLPVVGVVAAAIWKYGLWKLIKRIWDGPGDRGGSGDAAAATATA
jgi:hypothetical protein